MKYSLTALSPEQISQVTVEAFTMNNFIYLQCAPMWEELLLGQDLFLRLSRNHCLDCLLQWQFLQHRTCAIWECIKTKNPVHIRPWPVIRVPTWPSKRNSKAFWIVLTCQRLSCPKLVWVNYLIKVRMGRQEEGMGEGADVILNYAKNKKAVYSYWCDQTLQVARLYKEHHAASPGNYN